MKISSFDIFDTCLVRKCGTPENVFFILGKDLLPAATERELIIFVRIRIESEMEARFRLGREVTLEEIYQKADFSCITKLSNTTIMQQEIKCEQRLWSPINSSLNLINRQREKGDKIIFISDMYLPSKAIKEWLCINSFFHEGDKIFISGEIGKTKHSGELYTYIADDLNHKFSQWNHWGDNILSDYKQPKRLGIHSHLVDVPYTYYENLWRKRLFCPKVQYNSICAGISRAIKASYEPSPNVDITTDIIAPLLCSYVYRVLRDAHKNKIKHLYFASRDAKILLEIAKEIHSLFPSIVDLQYFYVSRSSLRQSSAENTISYFKHIGLANGKEKVGIVDTGCSGNQGCTFERINEILIQNGYMAARGYFLHYQNPKDDSIYWEFSESPLRYLTNLKPGDLQLYHSSLIEGFFTMTTDVSLDKYDIDKLIFKEKEDTCCKNKEVIVNLHFDICKRWIQYTIQTQMLDYIDNVCEQIAIPTFIDFCQYAPKHYTKALLDCRVDGKPLVLELSFVHLIKVLLGDKMSNFLIWKEGSMSLSAAGKIIKTIKVLQAKK